MTNSLGAKPVIDTNDFRSGIKQMNSELRVLESGFKASASALGDWTKDATGLETRITSLSSQLDIQRQKVAATRAEWERVKAEKGENSLAANKLETDLNKETEKLNTMQNELSGTEAALAEMRSETDQAGDAAEETGEQVEESGSKFERFQSILGGVGTVVKGAVTGLLAVGAAAVATIAMIAGLTFSSAAAADEFVELSAKTGISVERLQELNYIGPQVGTSLETITGANARLIRSMDDAKNAESEQAKAFQSLGVDVLDASGNLRDSQAVFADTIDALGQIENPTERDALAMQLFGKSAQELNPLIKAGSEELARLSDEAHKNGAVVSTETVNALGALQDQLDGLKGGLQGVGMTLAGAFAPFFSGVLGQAQGYLQELVGIISGSGGDFGKMAEGLAGLFTQIAGDIATQAPQMLKAGLSVIQSLLTAITGALPQMLKAGIEIIRSLIGFIVQNLPMLIGAAVEILLTLVTALIENLPMLIEAGLQAIITLAMGLAEALPVLIPAVVQALITIVETLIENIPLLIEAALALILGLAEGLIAAIPILIPAIPTIMKAIFDALIKALPMIGKAALELVLALIKGLVDNLPMIGKAAGDLVIVLVEGLLGVLDTLVKAGGELVLGIIDGIKDSWPDLVDAGGEMLDNIWKGFESGWDSFIKLIVGFFTNLVDTIKSILASLFDLFGGDGEAQAGTVFSPLFANIQRMRGELARLANASMAFSLAGAGAFAGASISQQTESFTFYSPVIIQGDTRSGSLGARLKARRY